MLYGNPLLGPTGEDPLYMYVEDLVESGVEARQGVNATPIDFIVEIPRRRALKKGQPLGRQSAYRDFSIVQVDEGLSKPDDATTANKSSRDWRAEGNQSLFAEAIALARKQQSMSLIPDSTFITGGASLHKDHQEDVVDKIAADVMDRVATDMGLRTSAEILYMRDLVTLGPARVSQVDEPRGTGAGVQANHYQSTFQMLGRNGRGYEDDGSISTGQHHDYDDAEGVHQEVDVEDQLPQGVFGRSMAEPQTLSSHPIAVRTAMRALQFAIRHPLTNYAEVPSKGFLPPKDYVRPTQASINRKMPRRELPKPKPNEALENAKGKAMHGLPCSFAAIHARETGRETTLQQIEEVLDGLNKHTDESLGKNNAHVARNDVETMNMMRNFARPNTGIKGLIAMVNEVVESLDS